LGTDAKNGKNLCNERHHIVYLEQSSNTDFENDKSKEDTGTDGRTNSLFSFELRSIQTLEGRRRV